MSRSFVGSSSSSTFGSPMSRRMSCRRRRSPPERSRTSVRARSPRKPKRSASPPAVSSRPSPSRIRPRISSSASSTRRCPGISAVSWPRWARRTVAPRSTAPASGLRSPARTSSSVVLPEPLAPTTRDAVAGTEAPRRVAQDRPVAERDRDVLRLDHLAAEPRRREPQQLDAVARLGLVGDERVRRLDAELRLGRARRRPAPQPRELLADELAAPVLARRGLAVALGAGEHVRGVAALVLVHRAVGDLPRRRAHRVEEPAVVRDDDERPAAGGEVAGEPVDGLDVEVVRRLVEQEQRRGGRAAARASAMRRRSPPDSGATGVSSPSARRRISTPPRRPSRTPRNAASPAHSWSARPPTSSSRTVRSAARSSPWPRRAAATPPVRVTVPASASSTPASSRSSVDLPSPLRPTIPTRSPSASPSVTSRSTERVP